MDSDSCCPGLHHPPDLCASNKTYFSLSSHFLEFKEFSRLYYIPSTLAIKPISIYSSFLLHPAVSWLRWLILFLGLESCHSYDFFFFHQLHQQYTPGISPLHRDLISIKPDNMPFIGQQNHFIFFGGNF